MKCLYFDCFSGISGDMTLGALIDLGVPLKYLKSELGKLNVSGYELRVASAMKMGISGKKVTVLIKTPSHHGHDHHKRTFKDIESILRKSPLKSHIKDRSLDIFLRMARAEAKVHKANIEDVHFHEVGAIDSIVDIVGSVIGIDYLKAEAAHAPSIPLGHGFVTCQHGILPLPAPATVLLLKDAPVYSAGIEGELVTPTGAAIITSYVREFGGMPPMTIEKTGYGAGTNELKDRPNMLRLMLGESTGVYGSDYVWVLETNLDDMSPEWAGYVMEQLFAAGALDVSFTPAYMKKNRPGFLISVICTDRNRSLLSRIIFRETTTAGIRAYRAERTILKRSQGSVRRKFGSMKVKIFEDDRGSHAVPEFEECRKAAAKHKVPLKAVYEEVGALGSKNSNKHGYCVNERSGTGKY